MITKKMQIDFLEKYKELETILRKKYSIHESESIRQLFYTKQELKRFNNDLNFLADVRNLYSHFQIKHLERYLILKESTHETIDSIKQRVIVVQRVYDSCVKMDKLLYAEINDNVYKFVDLMKEKDINSIPILEDGIVIGLFEENTLLEILKEESEILIDNELRFEEIKDYLLIKATEYIFVDINFPVEKLYNMYYESFIKGNPISFVFITERGDENSKLLGILTQYRISTFNV